MTFDQNLFISYAHIDDQPLTPGEKGWISRFHASLEAVLSMRMGAAARIWRDDKLRGNDVFGDEIVAQFPKTALLVSILSPRYIASEWCIKEAREFSLAAERSFGLVIGNKSRIIKVIKLPVETEDSLPPIMKEMLGYEFFTFDEEKTTLELDPAYGPDMAQKYNRKIAKLAFDITELLKKLSAEDRKVGAVGPNIAAAEKTAVYLAECSYDMREVRETLEADLKMHGYTVLPDRELPRDEAAYTAEVKRLLQRSKLAVHMIGSQYGSVPDGPSQKSVVVLQNELAVAECRARGLPRILWIPPSSQARNADQHQFVETLQKEPDAQFGADLITADVEAVKFAARAALEKVAKAAVAQKSASPPPTSQLVYLICDVKDRKPALPLRKLLLDAGFEVAIPSFSGDAATVRAANENLLGQCNAAVVYYGAGDEAWKRTVQSDLRKANAYRADKGAIPVFTFLAEPTTDDKSELIVLQESNLIDGLAGVPQPELIKPILTALRSP